MTYCAAILSEEGLVFASDSRTNAGVDQVSSFRKMRVYERENDRALVILSSGNLSVTQSAINAVERAALRGETPNIWNCKSTFDAAEMLGRALREVKQRDGPYLQQGNIEANANFIIGGQIGAEAPRLFLLRSDGQMCEASATTPFVQIGETKYGKPILDRVIHSGIALRDAVKCLLISFDSTMRSNVSVGLPIDLCSYRRNTLKIHLRRCITEDDPYFRTIHRQWSEGLRQIFADLPSPR